VVTVRRSGPTEAAVKATGAEIISSSSARTRRGCRDEGLEGDRRWVACSPPTAPDQIVTAFLTGLKMPDDPGARPGTAIRKRGVLAVANLAVGLPVEPECWRSTSEVLRAPKIEYVVEGVGAGTDIDYDKLMRTVVVPQASSAERREPDQGRWTDWKSRADLASPRRPDPQNAAGVGASAAAVS
jgi:hypothetical protein